MHTERNQVEGIVIAHQREEGWRDDQQALHDDVHASQGCCLHDDSAHESDHFQHTNGRDDEHEPCPRSDGLYEHCYRGSCKERQRHDGDRFAGIELEEVEYV